MATIPDQRRDDGSVDSTRSRTVDGAGGAAEWGARALRPVAHWVPMPTAGGRTVLTMVWEIPDPIPPVAGA